MPSKTNDRVVFSLYTTADRQARFDAASTHLGMSKAEIANRLLDAWLDGKLALSNLPKCPTGKKP